MEWWQILLIVLGTVLLLFLLTVFLYRPFFKRFWDIILSALAIIILIPVYLIISILVLIFMGKPILFSQKRIGKNEKIFKLYKFRSMTNAKDKDGNLLDESERLTKFGIFLRSTSLDELPELFSIFVGKMSFVGPRPQPKYYGPYYTEEELKIYTVRGGLIPPDSLCKEAQGTWEEQFKYELNYVKNITLWMDIKVIWYTFLILFKRVKTSYGKDERPHLNEYRSDWNIPKETFEKWENK